MKKVGIITIQSIVNYGNRLQNYAVQTLLEKRGFKAESIRLSEEKLWFKIYLKAYILGRILGKKNAVGAAKTRKIIRFNKEKINIKVLHKNNVKKYIDKNYEYLILGGDQLWATGNKDHGIPGYRFGSLIEKSKRIPFGVSFGGNITEKYKNNISKYLCELDNLAIREKQGADIIEDITGRKAEVLLDPVFGLDVCEWDELIKSVNIADTSYAVTFFLGGSNEERNTIIDNISQGRYIKRIEDRNNPSFVSGPPEFVANIKNAEIVFTDSFHCAAFAIIYNKPLVVFNRLNWDSSQMVRLYNLFEILQIGDRVYREGDIDWYDVDYSRCNNILETERNKINDYLDRCLK